MDAAAEAVAVVTVANVEETDQVPPFPLFFVPLLTREKQALNDDTDQNEQTQD